MTAMGEHRTPAIETVGLSKMFPSGQGLRPLHLQVAQGEIFGFLGPNGAGKTTTIRTLLGFLRPTEGQARLLGQDVWRQREAVHGQVGYLPGEVHLPGDLTAQELMRRSARLRGTEDMAYGKQLAERFELNLRAKLSTLSKGNRQKAGLVLALMHRPALLILDEPTDGLDPLVQGTVLGVLREAREEGRTVFLSSHVLSEVEHVADRVGIIRGGELIRLERLNELKASLPQRLNVRFSAPPHADLSRLPGLTQWRETAGQFQGLWHGAPDQLLRALAQESVAELSLTPSSLEDAFLGEYRQGEPHVA